MSIKRIAQIFAPWLKLLKLLFSVLNPPVAVVVKAWLMAWKLVIPKKRYPNAHIIVRQTYIVHKERWALAKFEKLRSDIGSEDSAPNIIFPEAPSRDWISKNIMTIPKPPNHCVVDRQTNSVFGIWLRSFKTVEPVVVNPLIASKKHWSKLIPISQKT